MPEYEEMLICRPGTKLYDEHGEEIFFVGEDEPTVILYVRIKDYYPDDCTAP